MEKHLKAAHILATLLDTRFRIGKINFGFTIIFDIIPGLGDVVAAVFSFYLVWIGIQMKLPGNKIAAMIGNIAFNFIIGLIPVFGGLVYILNKANMKNYRMLREYYQTSFAKSLPAI